MKKIRNTLNKELTNQIKTYLETSSETSLSFDIIESRLYIILNKGYDNELNIEVPLVPYWVKYIKKNILLPYIKADYNIEFSNKFENIYTSKIEGTNKEISILFPTKNVIDKDTTFSIWIKYKVQSEILNTNKIYEYFKTLAYLSKLPNYSLSVQSGVHFVIYYTNN